MNETPTSKKSQTDKNRLRAQKDEDIDVGEIPELRAEQLADAKLRFGLQGSLLAHLQRKMND